MFSKNNVTQSMIDAVESVLVEDKKLLLEPEKKKEVKEDLKGNKVKLDKNHNGKIDAEDFKLLRMKKEKSVEERHMSDDEMKEREHIVKSMKKGLAGFKERYGNRAKNVMYATATKQAMKEEIEQVDEATMTHITLGKKVKNSDGGHDQDVHYKGKKIGSIESYKHRTGLRYGGNHDATGHSEAGSRSPEEAVDFIRGSHAEHLKSMKEEIEELDELSKSTLGSYVKASAKDAEDAGRDQEHYGHKNDYARGEKRQKGIAKAVDRLTKEDYGLDEAINDNMHPTGVALLKHIKPEHHNLYKPHLTTDVFNGSFKDRHDVLSAAKQAGHLKEDIGAMQGVVGENKGKKSIRVDTLKGVTASTDPEVKIANAHFSGKSATLKAEGKGTDTAIPFVTDSATHKEINKSVKPTFKKIKEMLGKTGTSE
jgi:hypothetical protein